MEPCLRQRLCAHRRWLHANHCKMPHHELLHSPGPCVRIKIARTCLVLVHVCCSRCWNASCCPAHLCPLALVAQGTGEEHLGPLLLLPQHQGTRGIWTQKQVSRSMQQEWCMQLFCKNMSSPSTYVSVVGVYWRRSPTKMSEEDTIAEHCTC